jgi:Predicted membrane protein
MEPDRPGRVRRATAWSKSTAARAGEWAHGARDDHASIDVGFRTLDRDHRAAAMVLAGGIAYRLFFWMLALSLVLGGLLGLLDPGDIQATLTDHGFGVWAAAAIAKIGSSAEGNEWWLLLTGAYLVLWTGYTCTKALVLTHAAIWQVQPPKVKRPVRASLIFNGYTLGFIAAVAFARWLREQNSTEGLAATLLVIVVPFGSGCRRLAHSRTGPGAGSTSRRARQLLPSGFRRCTCSRLLPRPEADERDAAVRRPRRDHDDPVLVLSRRASDHRRGDTEHIAGRTPRAD